MVEASGRRPLTLLLLTLTATLSDACAFLVTSFHVDEQQLRQAGEWLVPRGPDATNKAVHHGWTIVHYLLHMHGRKTQQPFMDEGTTRLAAFNGEVYNYREIQEKASVRDPFVSDGQALLPAYELARKSNPANISAAAAQFVASLDGEFAVAVIDHVEGVLILGTDPFATKPLFFACADGRFAAASYPSAVQLLGFRRSQIVEVQANKAIIVDMRRKVIISEVMAVKWRLAQFVHNTSRWKAAFRQALAKRLFHSGSGVDVSMTLSYGMDSGLIHCMANVLGAPHTTYSIHGIDPLEAIAARIAWGNHTVAAYAAKLTSGDCEFEASWMKKHVDIYRYQAALRTPAQAVPIHQDDAARGISMIYRHARNQKRRLFLVGIGPDEHMTMYRPPRRFPINTAFPTKGPLRTEPFPNTSSLKGFFPWPMFTEHSLRGGLRREEFIAGAYGIESRYPFLDKDVVQAWLELAPEIKNGRYKGPIVDQMIDECKGYPLVQKKLFYTAFVGRLRKNDEQRSQFAEFRRAAVAVADTSTIREHLDGSKLGTKQGRRSKSGGPGKRNSATKPAAEIQGRGHRAAGRSLVERHPESGLVREQPRMFAELLRFINQGHSVAEAHKLVNEGGVPRRDERCVNISSILSFRPTWNQWLHANYLWHESKQVLPSLFSLVADKLRVKPYVLRQNLNLSIPRTLWNGSTTSGLVPEFLPSSYVIKSNHGSGQIIPVKDGVDLTTSAKVDLAEVSKQSARWLQKNYGHRSGEWWYTHIERKLLIEEWVDSSEPGETPLDYKFHMIHNRPVLIQVDSTRFSKHRRELITPDWTLLRGFQLHSTKRKRLQSSLASAPRPKVLDRMLEIAVNLSAPFVYIRVDLYVVKKTVYFSELTFAPEAGNGRFQPAALDNVLGYMLAHPASIDCLTSRLSKIPFMKGRAQAHHRLDSRLGR